MVAEYVWNFHVSIQRQAEQGVQSQRATQQPATTLKQFSHNALSRRETKRKEKELRQAIKVNFDRLNLLEILSSAELECQLPKEDIDPKLR